jgi:hypothetical protein
LIDSCQIGTLTEGCPHFEGAVAGIAAAVGNFVAAVDGTAAVAVAEAKFADGWDLAKRRRCDLAV